MSGFCAREDDEPSDLKGFETPSRDGTLSDLNVSHLESQAFGNGGSLPSVRGANSGSNKDVDKVSGFSKNDGSKYFGVYPGEPHQTGVGGAFNKQKKKQHTRSASHVGILRNSDAQPHRDQGSSFKNLGSGSGAPHGSCPSHIKGHQRAHSQGQMHEGKGHKREGSRTDFILPEGHEQRELERERRSTKKQSLKQRTSLHRKGHSREASRTESVYTIRDQKKTILEKIQFWKKGPVETCTRLIVPNHIVPTNVKTAAHPNNGYADNKICTTKYTLLTFLPKNLFEQFHRFANLYFLFIVLLNFAPSINAFAKEMAVLPLVFVLGVTAIKDVYEDMRRRKSDLRVNKRTCRVYSSLHGRYMKRTWDEIRAGDVVHLSCDEMIPADIVLLNSSDEQGICYIESSDLDGETNLKQRQSIRGIGMDEGFEVSKFDNVLEVGPPTTKIYHFVGSVPLNSRERIPLTKDNLILRDCVIKNTDYVEGIVVYAGRETKSLLNNGGTRYKRSKLERQMNREVIFCVVILCLMSISSAIGSALWLVNNENGYYMWVDPASVLRNGPGADEPHPFWIVFTSFWTYIIIYQVVIPISLYVTIEIIKVMQIYHIHHDPHFKNDKNGTNINCRALNITEELGQVEYVFTDKTGTLTENNMIFQRCSINGVDYDHSPLIVNDKQENTRDTFLINHQLLDELKTLELQYLYSQPGSRAAVISKSSSVSQRQNSQRILDFFFTLTACNTVIVARHPHKDQMNASGMIIVNPLEDKIASDSPRHSQTNKNHLLRSLFPAPRSLSPIASSPNPSPPGTPDGSPKQQSHIFHLSKFPHSFGFKSNRHPEITVNTFESVPENEAAPDCTDIKFTRPTDLPLNGNHVHSLPISRTPSPATPLEFQKPIFEAESPDELALVDAAYKYGCKLLRRNIHSVLLSLPGIGVTEYEVLNVLPFDSNRKRMSIIVMNPETGEKVLYCKGADSAVLENLVQRPDEATQLRIFQTEQHLNHYSKKGLRVLCMAKRHISDMEYEEWSLIQKEAENSLVNREMKLQESYSRIEINMQLLGATGIEDRLQDGVPETVKALREAGINVWVLTGDKQETAINIAYSCSLFSPNMEILKLNARNKDQTEHTLVNFVNQVEMEEEAFFRSLNVRNDNNASNSLVNDPTGGLTSTLERRRRRRKERGLVIDGKTLVYILDRRANLRGLFLQLATQCQAVMCCRATPLQKALIVRLAKEDLHVLTLAIGDGANDVSMIQTADVGVGISGVEGRQAVLSSDFAITRFRHLQKLLLVHGHWCYDRLAKIILYFFYKNANFVFLLMWYQLYCGFSTAVMVDELYLVMFNLSFTSIPPICVGIYDQDAPEDILLSKPELYSKTRRGKVYTKTSFWINIVDAFYQSIVLFFVAVAVYNHSEAGVYELGMTILHSCVVAQLLHIGIETNSWTLIQAGGIIVSIIIFYLFGVLYTMICNGCMGLESQFGEFVHMMVTPKHWFCVILSAVLALLPRFVIRSLQATVWPDGIIKALIDKSAINQGHFLEKMSRASSISSIYRPRFDSGIPAGGEEDASEAMSSLVTMTTFVSTSEDTDA